MFNFTPLLGAQSQSGAIQSLLQFDGGVKVLVDVGWDDEFSDSSLDRLREHVPTISLILLTHATKEHLGAYAHCCKHIPLFACIPVYATHPVISLGRTLLQDLYSASRLAASIVGAEELAEEGLSDAIKSDGDDGKTQSHILLQPPTAKEIAVYFDSIHRLKYSQPHQPIPAPWSAPLNGLTVTAYSAGHSLGGTLWHIQHGLESVVYAVDWNQAREHVIAGAAWLDGPGGSGSEVVEHLRRPTALICSSRGSERVAMAGGRKRRDEVLLNHIRTTLSQGGSVLIPSDSSARMLELAFVLEEAAKADAGRPDGVLHRHRITIASRTCSSTMLYARSMLEWMDEGMIRQFEAANAANDAHERSRGSKLQAQKNDRPSVAAPFDFRFVKTVERTGPFKRLLDRSAPKVILASDSSLEWGFSNTALAALSTDSRNKVILTDRAACPSNRISLSRMLWDVYVTRTGKADGAADDMAQVVRLDDDFPTVRVEPAVLDEPDNAAYDRLISRRRQAIGAGLETGPLDPLELEVVQADGDGPSSSDEEDESDTEHQGKALNVSAAINQTRSRIAATEASLGVNVLLRGSGRYDFDVRGRRGRDKMFPFASRRRRVDEYGEIIRPEDYVRDEEKEEDSTGLTGPKFGSRPDDPATGLKRKWDSPDTDPLQSVNGFAKRPKMANRFGRSDDRSETELDDDRDDDLNGSENDEDGEETVGPDGTSEGPKKVVVTREQLRVRMSVAFVDFSGRHDKRSLYMLIPLIRPRKLILVGGEKNETESLADDCRKLSSIHSVDPRNSTVVFTPENGGTVDASVDTHSWVVKLSQDLVRKLQWQRVRGLGVVALRAHLRPAVSTAVAEGEEESEPDDSSTYPILDLVQPGSAVRLGGMTATPLHVGDLRLAELRRLMQTAGYVAEFKGDGVLLVNGCVIVRKNGPGKVEIENIMCGPKDRSLHSFYEIRQKIYEELAVVNGA